MSGRRKRLDNAIGVLNEETDRLIRQAHLREGSRERGVRVHSRTSIIERLRRMYPTVTINVSQASHVSAELWLISGSDPNAEDEVRDQLTFLLREDSDGQESS